MWTRALNLPFSYCTYIKKICSELSTVVVSLTKSNADCSEEARDLFDFTLNCPTRLIVLIKIHLVTLGPRVDFHCGSQRTAGALLFQHGCRGPS